MKSTLSRFPETSFLELWTLSLPLMIFSLASLAMIFTDRIFLAEYSIDALNASVHAGTLALALMTGFGMITMMSEIFVARLNGAERHREIGRPVWQMVWFSLLSFLFFIPMGVFGSPLLFDNPMEMSYFRLLCFFSPGYVLSTSFAGFFVGRGKTSLLIYLAVSTNLLNIVLDRLLIFGVPGLIPEMGLDGAAIATCVGYLCESVILGTLFLRKENRLLYGTSQWKPNFRRMKKYLKVGLPQGIFYFLEMFGWSVFYWMMNSVSDVHMTISSICQSFTFLLSFFCEGLGRGSATIAGNLIGANRSFLVHRVLFSGIKLLILFSIGISFFLLVHPLESAKAFLDPIDSTYRDGLRMCMYFAFFYLLFDGIRWVLHGLLIAAKDTLFLLIFGSLSIWLFLLTPVYFLVIRLHLSVEWAWGATVFYSALFMTTYLLRFRKIYDDKPQKLAKRVS